MSSKISPRRIFRDHHSTLVDKNGKVEKPDIFTFYVLPYCVAATTLYFRLPIPDSILNILVTAGSIFTGLLLNLLILVHDQRQKLPPVDATKPDVEEIQRRHTILKETHFNISYATLISLLIVLLSILYVCLNFEIPLDAASTNLSAINLAILVMQPLLVFFTMNLGLIILMILKRVQLLLTSN